MERVDYYNDHRKIAEQIFEVEHNKYTNTELKEFGTLAFPNIYICSGKMTMKIERWGKCWFIYKTPPSQVKDGDYCKCVPRRNLTIEEIENVLKAQPWK